MAAPAVNRVALPPGPSGGPSTSSGWPTILTVAAGVDPSSGRRTSNPAGSAGRVVGRVVAAVVAAATAASSAAMAAVSASDRFRCSGVGIRSTGRSLMPLSSREFELAPASWMLLK